MSERACFCQIPTVRAHSAMLHVHRVSDRESMAVAAEGERGLRGVGAVSEMISQAVASPNRSVHHAVLRVATTTLILVQTVI